ncbi:pyridoxal phosphate-dependent aminotransferase [Candidatus Bipolaricaulota bacterium]|nr:pyridoxal phosphate-dependent aminotransferase [Candidatus Bipolaricaulota bacterium]
MPNISMRAKETPSSPIRKLAPLCVQAEQAGKTVYRLNIGQPDLATPQSFMDGVRKSTIEVLSYSPSQGLPETLLSLCRYYAEHDIKLTEDEIIITIGGSEAFIFAMKAVMDPGDEVIIPEPFYPNYRGYARLVDVTVVPITTYAEDGFHLPPPVEMEKKITSRTKAILFSNPGNPTGVTYSEKELAHFVYLAEKYDLFLISDEVYREFVYDGAHMSILAFDSVSDRTILVDSISKRISACGARIGMVASHNREVMEALLKMAQGRLSPPTFGQLGLNSFLSSPYNRTEVAAMIEQFHRRRDTVYSEISDIPGIVCKKPEGAFYLFPKLPIDDSEDFARWLLAEFDDKGETVMIAPGSGFYHTPGKGSDEIRLAYVLDEDVLVRAIEVFRCGLAEYQKLRSPLKTIYR